MAQRTPANPARSLMLERADAVQRLWGLPAAKWVRGLQQVDK